MEGLPQQFNAKPLQHAWIYRATDGAPLGIVGRYERNGAKDVVPFFKRNGTGWLAGAAAEPRPLYGLDQLAKLTKGKAALIVEGEKAAAALHSLGIVAVTSPGGCKAAVKTDWEPLAGLSKVFLLPDHDEPGEHYACTVCAALSRLDPPPKIMIVRLPELSAGGDIVDWLQARLPDWDGYAPIPKNEHKRLVLELRQTLTNHAAAPPATLLKPVTTGNSVWPAPIPLDAATLPDWPRDVFPQPLQGFTDSLSAATETPPELAALMVLAVLATTAQGKYRVQIKADYCEPLNLWTCCTLPPGSRKTAVQNTTTMPLSVWEQQQRQDREPAIAETDSERKTLSARIDKLRKQAAGAKGQSFQELKETIKDLEAELPEVPTIPQLWSEDVTPENLGTLMAENQERISILSDEGGIFATMNGRYAGGVSNLDLFLKGHAGAPVRVNRGSRPPVFLHHPAISMGLTVQPELLRGLTAKPENRGRGLLARFLYALPPSNLGYRSLDAPPLSQDWKLRYSSIITTLLNKEQPLDDNGQPSTHRLKLDPAALAAWKDFEHQVETAMREGGQFEHITDWAGKLPGAVARIAALLHVARYATRAPQDHLIGLTDMTAALTVAEALSDHALAAFDVMGADTALEGARVVLRWLRSEQLPAFTFRDCYQRFKGRYKRAAELEPALVLLEERHFIRCQRLNRQGPGRPPRIFDVNPAVFSADDCS